jgi:hypothetical protein
VFLIVREVFWFAVHGRRGGDDSPLGVVFPGSFEDIDRAVNVVVVDLYRFFNALAYACLGGLVIEDIYVGGVQIRMKSEAVRFLSALCPKTTASTDVWRRLS